MPGERDPWYADGLRFSCTRCGQCCRIEGHVWVEMPEVDVLARFLELPTDRFARRYLRRVAGRLSLLEKPDRACVFWDGRCTVYPVRPRQCRTFPFWKNTLSSAAAWQDAAGECGGIGSGRLYSLPEIERLAVGKGETATDRAPSTPAPFPCRSNAGGAASPATD